LTRTVEEICQRLEARFPEGAPADRVVRAQGFDYLTVHWTDRWPAHLPIPGLLSGPERGHVSRSDVFAIAADVSSVESVLNLYVAVCAWGTGTKAQRVARVVKPLHEDGAADALRRSFEAARSMDPVEAYRRLNLNDEDRIKGFGPAFFTKWLYFAAYDDPARHERRPPLILDARVANSLGWPPVSGRWPSSAYSEYLELRRPRSTRLGARQARVMLLSTRCSRAAVSDAGCLSRWASDERGAISPRATTPVGLGQLIAVDRWPTMLGRPPQQGLQKAASRGVDQ
jgi:hypothetical protein